MGSNIFSFKKDFLISIVGYLLSERGSSFQYKGSYSTYQKPLINKFLDKKVYVTDFDQDITFSGIVDSYITKNGNTSVSLKNVEAYQYSSANPLFNLPKISFSKPASRLFVEEVSDLKN